MTRRTRAGDTSILVDGSAHADQLLVLGHGAGAGMESDFMMFFATHLASDELAVARFNFRYMAAGRRTPDRQPVSEGTFREVVDHLRSDLRPKRIYLGGKSYGGRIASHIVAQGAAADALLFLGYPLHPPGRPDRMRDAHLRDIRCPLLFVEGTRDPFCPLETLDAVRKKLAAPTEVLVVKDGDHSLKVRKTSGRTTTDAWADAASGIARWLDALRY